jgi:putative MATE family efflux protein
MQKAAGRRVTMTEGPLLGVLLRVAWPITAAGMAQALHQMINAWFVGRLGADAIAAVSASGALFYILISLGGGLSTAGAVLVAQNAGAGKARACDHIAAQTLLMVLAVGLGFTALGFACARPVLRLIGVETGVYDLTWQYLAVSYAGLVPMFAFMALQAMLQSSGEVRFAMQVMIGAVLLNVLLDPILIFGIAPLGGTWQGLGVAGAALATVIAQISAFAVLLHHMMSGRSALHLKPQNFRPDWPHFRLALGIGLPASLEQGGRTLGSVLLMSFAALFGTVSLAAYGVGSRPFFFWFTPMLGLSVATAVVVGQNIGAGRMDRVEQAARLSGWLAFTGFTVIGVVHLPFLRAIMEALAPGEPAVVRQAMQFGWAVFPFMGFMGLVQALNGVFRGAGSTRHSMTISLVMQYALQIPFAWGITQFTSLGAYGVWWSYAFANVVTSAIVVWWLRKGQWRRTLVPAEI